MKKILNNLEPGKQCYFDLMGKTNRPEIFSVTIISKVRFSNKYNVVDDESGQIMRVHKKHLTPINNINREFLVNQGNNPNACIPFTHEEYRHFEIIVDFLSRAREAMMQDSDKYRITSDQLETVIIGLKLVMCKVATHFMTNEEIENISTIKNIDSRKKKNDDDNTSSSEVNTSNSKTNGSSNLVEAQSKMLKEFDAKFFDAIKNEEISTIDEKVEYIEENLAPECIMNNASDPHVITLEEIEGFSEYLYDHSRSINETYFIYLETSGSSFEVRAKVFSEEDDFPDIFKYVSDVVQKGSILPTTDMGENNKFITPFRLVSIDCSYRGGEEDNE